MVCSSHILFNGESFAGVLVEVDSMAQSTGKVYLMEIDIPARLNFGNTADL